MSRTARYEIRSPKGGRVYVVTREDQGDDFGLIVLPPRSPDVASWRMMPAFIADLDAYYNADGGRFLLQYLRTHSAVHRAWRNTGLGFALYVCAAYAAGDRGYRGVYSWPRAGRRSGDADRVWDALRARGRAMRVPWPDMANDPDVQVGWRRPPLVDILHTDVARATGLVRPL